MATPAEIAAYLGAAAWLPITGAWIHRAAVRPFVTITPDKVLEIGYTRFGPIFNVNLAIAVEKKDAMLEHLGVRILHANGDTHSLEWVGMSETFSQIRDAAGNQQVVEKAHQAIALRLSQYMLTERLVRFQDPAYHNAVRDPTSVLGEHIAFLQANDRSQEVMESRQLHDLEQQMRHQFWWSPGRYEVEFQARSPHRARIRKRRYAFTLSQGEIDRLRRNLDLIRLDFEDHFRLGEEGYQLHQPKWQWVNPYLSPV